MDLSFGPEYDEFRNELRAFIEKYRDRASKPGAGVATGKSGARMKDWQALLIDHGYAARNIPKEYGGYGAEPDLLQARDPRRGAERAPGCPAASAARARRCWCRRCSSTAARIRGKRWIGPTLRGEVVWCQGYSEPAARQATSPTCRQKRSRRTATDFLITGPEDLDDHGPPVGP